MLWRIITGCATTDTYLYRVLGQVFSFGYWYNSWPFPSCMRVKATCAYNLPIFMSSLIPDITHHSALTYSGFILSSFDIPLFSLWFFYLVFIFYVLT